MTFKTLETQIIERLVKDLIAAGYKIRVNDGEENRTEFTDNTATIMEEAGATCETYFHVSNGRTGHNSAVVLIHGNDQDVISDYGLGLEHVIAPIYADIERL